MTRPRKSDSRRGTVTGAPRDGSIELYDDELEAAVRAEIGEEYDDYALISEYLAGDLSPAEKERVEERLSTDPKFRALAEPLRMVWNRTAPVDREEDLADRVAAERGWQRLKKRIELEEQGIHTPTFAEKRQKRRRRRAVLLATIGGLITSLFAAWLRPQLFPAPSFYQHVDALVDAERIARLPDETQATLGPGSHLSYSRLFSDERTLTLDGMGTFIVAPGARKALTVAGAGVVVKASAGRFTVVAYNAMPLAFVRVDEGRAEVRARTLYGTSHALTLHPGQAARVGPGLQIDRADVPIAAAGAEPATPKEGPAPVAIQSATPTDTAVPPRSRVIVAPETALADAIARDFGQRPREVAFGKRDTINILFWNPAFWQSDIDSKAFPMGSLPVVGQSAKHVAQFVWTTYGRKAGFHSIRIAFIRVIRDRNLLDPTREVPAQEVSSLFTRGNLEGDPSQKAMLGIVQCEGSLCIKGW